MDKRRTGGQSKMEWQGKKVKEWFGFDRLEDLWKQRHGKKEQATRQKMNNNVKKE